MASPDRDPIWTARLLIIAINDGDERTARAIFAPEGAVTFFEHTITPEQRDDWISDDVFGAGVAVRVRQNDADGRVVRIIADWGPDDAAERVLLTFVQSDDGRIETLDVRQHP